MVCAVEKPQPRPYLAYKNTTVMMKQKSVEWKSDEEIN